jgi:hypothetical protein
MKRISFAGFSLTTLIVWSLTLSFAFARRRKDRGHWCFWNKGKGCQASRGRKTCRYGRHRRPVHHEQ